MKNFLKKLLTMFFIKSIIINVQPVKRPNEIPSNDSYLVSQIQIRQPTRKKKLIQRWRELKRVPPQWLHWSDRSSDLSKVNPHCYSGC